MFLLKARVPEEKQLLEHLIPPVWNIIPLKMLRQFRITAAGRQRKEEFKFLLEN